LSVVKKAKYDKNSVYFASRWAANHSSVLLKPRERGCFAYFHHKNGYGVGACHGKPDFYGWVRGFAMANPYIMPS